jgi:hypothetical protein
MLVLEYLNGLNEDATHLPLPFFTLAFYMVYRIEDVPLKTRTGQE